MADPIMVPVDPALIPEGYEVVEFRRPKDADFYLHKKKVIRPDNGDDFLENEPCLILRKKRWRAEPDGEYWIIHSGGAAHDQYDNRDPSDDHLYNLGNYFRTREEAEAFLPKFKALFAERLGNG